MNDMQDWESTPEEYIETYSFIDKEQIYTNGSKLISVFRVEQMLEHYYKERTYKNLATRKDDFYCSECGCEVVGCMVDDSGSFDNPLCFSYCPNCRAKVVI